METMSLWVLVLIALVVVGVPGVLISMMISGRHRKTLQAEAQQREAFVDRVAGHSVLVHRDNPNLVYVQMGKGGDMISVKEVWRNEGPVADASSFRAPVDSFRSFDAALFLSTKMVLTREGRWIAERRHDV